MMQIAEPESTRDDAHPIATSIASIGRVKRLLKIADQMQPELERDQPFARMVARVGKLDVDRVPVGFAFITAVRNSDTAPLFAGCVGTRSTGFANIGTRSAGAGRRPKM